MTRPAAVTLSLSWPGRSPETLAGAAVALRRGETTALALWGRCRERIEAIEPELGAWVVVDSEGAGRAAHAADEALAAGSPIGPLHGIPLGIKDIVDVAGLPTACGTRRWAGRVAERDAPLVARLRAAGAVIVGKTVTTPYAWVDPPRTRNPWDLDRTPGGSSSGSAAAVAAGMVLGAIGTQTGGSITRPAAFCGVCGLKPTHGRLPLAGILPFAPTLDHSGPIARTVGDLALLWDVLAGPPAHGEAPSRTTLGPPTLLRLGGFFDELAEPAQGAPYEAALSLLGAAGIGLRSAPPPFDVPAALADHRTVMAAEGAAVHQADLAAFPDDYPPRITALIEEGSSLDAIAYVLARARLDAARRDASRLFPPDVDAFVTPAALGPAPGPETTGDPRFNSPWSYFGLPTVNLPCGLAPGGLPIGLQLVGRPRAERALLRVAEACERALAAGGPPAR
jgi:aspartyl-tRNA(Asn)/glutamyl-tRNA(Gln) amidotransferase subunit A